MILDKSLYFHLPSQRIPLPTQKQNQFISFSSTTKQINDICKKKLFSRIIAESWDQLWVDFHAIPVYIFTSIKVLFSLNFLQQFINVTWHFAYLNIYVCISISSPQDFVVFISQSGFCHFSCCFDVYLGQAI